MNLIMHPRFKEAVESHKKGDLVNIEFDIFSKYFFNLKK